MLHPLEQTATHRLLENWDQIIGISSKRMLIQCAAARQPLLATVPISLLFVFRTRTVADAAAANSLSASFTYITYILLTLRISLINNELSPNVSNVSKN